MSKTAKRLIALATLIVLLLACWIAAGPFMAIRGIQQAMDTRDVSKLERHVDYPALRANLRAQLEDRIAREIGRRFGPESLGNVGNGMGHGILRSALTVV